MTSRAGADRHADCGSSFADHQAVSIESKAAGKYLGLSYSSLYQLVVAGEIEHVMVGSRRYITRDQIVDFITANSHKGYHAR